MVRRCIRLIVNSTMKEQTTRGRNGNGKKKYKSSNKE